MRYPPTIDACENVLRILGHEWRGEWQREAAQSICDNPLTIIQGPRQAFGKTFVAAIVGATFVMSGHTEIVGYPTLTQSQRLLTRATASNVDQIGKLLPGGFKKPVDTLTERVWALREDPDYSGSLLALSMNETARSKPEGYTADLLVMDEGHRSGDSVLGIFSPFLNVARREGRAHMAILGVGGHRSMIIETQKSNPQATVIRYTAEDIARLDPTWQAVFDEEHALLSDWQWRQHYMCEQATEGLRLMHPEVPGLIDVQEAIARGIPPKIHIGIDVGKVIDSTVVKVLSVVHTLVKGQAAKVINEVDSFEITGCSYMDQAAAIYKWIDGRFYWRADSIVVELNGVGQAFYDILCDVFGKRLRGIHTTADLKEQFWHELSVAIREGRFGVKNAEARLQYESMMYNVRESDGKLEFEHSDYWMALCMAWVATQQAEAL